MDSDNIIIETKDVWKIYKLGKIEYPALRGVSVRIRKGEFVSIMGPSGSGKSTFLNLIGALDRPTRGEVLIDGKRLKELSDEQLARFRRNHIGFIFQTFNLIPRLTALENVEVPMIANGIPAGARKKRAMELLELVGLKEVATHRPNELSGGEQQRVAIARALANNPKIILADEPTGNLDTKNKISVMQLLSELNKKKNVTIIVVTHDPMITEYTPRIISLRDGKIISDTGVNSR